MWVGPVANWIGACDLMLGMDLEKIVPGHGPITDKEGVRAIKDYFEYLAAEVRRRYDAGMTAGEAVADIDPGPYASWGDLERIVINVHVLYREFSGESTPINPIALFEEMARYSSARK
jgi:cyclase